MPVAGHSDGLGERLTGVPTPPATTRLHISPLDPSTVGNILAPSVLPLATKISYHTIQTFPDKCYGYVDLPTMEAQKLKRKLNGAILKGTKLRVEDALPERGKRTEEDEAPVAVEGKPSEKKRKREEQKREHGVLPGFGLPGDRRVKRGWTEPVSLAKQRTKVKENKKPKTSSKYTTEQELLFRARVPKNRAADSSRTVDKKKQRTEQNSPVVVHEFSANTKHTDFLEVSRPSHAVKMVSGYVDGVGWVDEDGNIVESEKGQRRKGSYGTAVSAPGESKHAVTNAESTMLLDAIFVKGAHKGAAKERFGSGINPNGGSNSAKPETDDDAESDEATESESGQDEETEGLSNPDGFRVRQSRSGRSDKHQFASIKEEMQKNSRPSSRNRRVSFAGAEPRECEEADPNTPGQQGVWETIRTKPMHPLEALYKRTKSSRSNRPATLALLNTSFSFFEDSRAEDDVAAPPQTPFTKRDLEHRMIRSPAPAPDTAVRQRSHAPWALETGERDDCYLGDDTGEIARFSPASGKSVGKDCNGSAVEEGEAAPKTETHGAESDFAKWFWANRGVLNRDWKRRRREVLKQKRQVKNRQ